MRDFSTTQLTTERLLLRPLNESDADALFAIHSDAQFMRYWSCLPWESRTVAEEFVARDQQQMALGESLRLGIEERESLQLIGTCTLYSFHVQCRRAEFGFGVARSAWGHGFGREAGRELLRFGFDELGLNRVEADIDPRNLACAKTLERLGFVREGLFRERWIIGGQRLDSAMYGVLRDEFLAS
jgi:RimJ/RimL family protein N-acetyltransferase